MTQTQTTSAPRSPQANGTPRHDIAVQMQQMRPQFAAALPAHIPVEKFERTALTAVALNPDLLAADRRSLFLACNQAAADGLLPDGRDGAIVVFKGKATWMPMVWGLVKKIRQSGEVSTITAQVVYENDLFSYVLGDDERIEHKPLLTGDRGKPILAYAIAKLRDGGIQREVMTVQDVEKARKTSRAPNSPMWSQWWTEGARKTVLRRLCKYLPLSAEDRRTIERDDTEFEAQKRDALLEKAAEQIGAPALAYSRDEAATVEGEVVDDDIERTLDEGDAVDADAANAEASAALRDKLIAELAAIPDEANLTAYKTECAEPIAALTEADRGAFNTAFVKRQQAVARGKK